MPLIVHITTPDAEALRLECDELVVPGADGVLGLLPQHAPLSTGLRPGVLTTILHARDHTIGILMGTAETYYALGGGDLTLRADEIHIRASTCERADRIDVARARRALADAEATMATLMSLDAPGFLEAETRAARAHARLDAARLAG